MMDLTQLRSTASVGCRGCREAEVPLNRRALMWRLSVARRKAYVGSYLPSDSDSDSDELELPACCRHCRSDRFSLTNAALRRHERICGGGAAAPAWDAPLCRGDTANAQAGATEKEEEERVAVIFEQGPLGFALSPDNRRTCSTVFPCGPRNGNVKATGQLSLGWTLVLVAGKRVRPERDLVMAQIRFAPRPVALTWRTNGIAPPDAPPTAAPDAPPTPCKDAPVTPPTTPCKELQRRRPSLPDFNAARRTLRKTLSGSLAGSSPAVSADIKQHPPLQQTSAADFHVAVLSLRKTLSGAYIDG